jgi:NAD-dependent deacetylase sirtuin 4
LIHFQTSSRTKFPCFYSRYARTNHKPIQFPDFVKSASTRKRYWARNFIGWPKFSQVEPSKTHRVLAKMERDFKISGLVTQNVDSLHSKAGSKNVIEMHGTGYKVICLGCDYSIPRHDFQMILTQLNPDIKDTSTMVRPDGDIEIPQETIDRFNLPQCPNCGGNLKPDIVFFGDNIPLKRIEKIVSMICTSDGVLVLGSSLTVFSGYRIVLQAKELNLPVAIVNIGDTRGDPKADLKVSAKCGDIIEEIFK